MQWQAYINTGVGVLSSLGFAVAYMMISDTLIQSLLKEKQMAIKHQIIISGGSKLAYWLSHYFLDVITHALPAFITCCCVDVFQVDVP
jgi:ABC-2 family transporter protein